MKKFFFKTYGPVMILGLGIIFFNTFLCEDSNNDGKIDNEGSMIIAAFCIAYSSIIIIYRRLFDNDYY